jgi:hypothetical protein
LHSCALPAGAALQLTQHSTRVHSSWGCPSSGACPHPQHIAKAGARALAPQPSFRSYAVVGNLLTMFESTMCLQIAGGDGCDEPTPTPGNETSPGV